MGWVVAWRRRTASASRLARLAPVLTPWLCVAAASPARAQYQIGVPFTRGFIGTRGSSAARANDVRTYATLGISRTFFIQNSSTTQFELQGNDIPGTLRIVRTDGTTLDVPALANWRNNGGATTLIGILPRPTSPITFTYPGGSIQITDGSGPGGSSVGGYVVGHTGSELADGGSENGNAAQSQVLGALNDYLIANRPAGPVTVATALTTSSAAPTLSGTATLAAGEALSVSVGGREYTTSTSPAVARSGPTWSLALSTRLAVGTYAVTATITDADGFTLGDGTTNELVVAPTPVTLGGALAASDKVYDGTTAASGATGGLSLVGVAGGHQVSIAAVTLAFPSAGVGAGKPVAITGATLGGADAAQYTVTLAGAPAATASITPRPVAVAGLSAVSRPYDGTTAVALAGTAAYVGLADAESFAVTGAPAASVASPAVGTGKAVTVTGFAPPNANYAIQQPAGLQANVTARTVTVAGTFSAADKSFDGTASATIAARALTLTGVVPGETLTLTGVAAAFASAGVGAAKPVTLTAATLAGATASNYALSLVGAPSTTASITAAAPTAVTLGGTLAANDKTYDGTVTATGSVGGLTLVGVTAGHQVTVASATLAFQSVGVGAGKTVAITGVTLGGADGGRYAASLAGAPTATASITARPVTLGGALVASDKPFDGGTAATIDAGGLTVVGVLAGDAVTLAGATAAFADPHVGVAKPVTLTAATLTGAASGNYALSLSGAPTASAAITGTAAGPAIVTLGGTLTADDKVYDATTVARGSGAGLALAGVAAGHQVGVAGVTLAFQSRAAGTGRVVITGVTLSGADAQRYAVSLSGAPSTTARITPRPLTLGGSFTAADKVYDGSVAATTTGGAFQLIGTLGGDAVALGPVSVAFADPSVGTGKRVAVSGAALTGASAGNYMLALSGAPTARASILPAPPAPPPRTLSVTAGDGRLAVTWAAPDGPGCHAPTGYVIEYTADEARGWQHVTVAASPTSATLTGLVNQRPYRVRVAAVSPCGTGAFAAAAPVAPEGPARDGAGRATPAAPGTVGVVVGGAPRAVTTTVVHDTVVRVTGDDFSLAVRALDAPGVAIPVDGTRALALEQGGRAAAEGRGFAPGSRVTLYLVSAAGQPLLLGAATVDGEGAFAGAGAVPATLAPGDYTLQVNGIDADAQPRTATLGVEVTPPPPVLALAVVADEVRPAVGDTVTITLTVTNSGRGAALDVVIPRAFREPGFAVVRTTPVDGTYRAVAQEWAIPRIEPGARARLLLTAVVLAPGAAQPAPAQPPTPQPTP